MDNLTWLKTKWEKKSSSDNIRINNDNVNRCKTGEHNSHKRKERTENMSMHGNAKAKHIPMKITMIGRSKKTGSTEYKKVGNSEEEKSPSALIETIGQTVEKHIPLSDPIKRLGHSEEKNVATSSNKLRHPEEYSISSRTETHLNSESGVFNSLEADRGCGYQTGPDKTNSRIN